MNTKINSLEIKKYIISKFGVDPTPIFDDKYLQEALAGEFSRNRAFMYLKELKATWDQNSGLTLEQFVASKIKELYEGGRSKRFAIILLLVAKAQRLVGPQVYKQLRELMGAKKTDEDLENRLKETEPQLDAFDILLNN